MSRVLCLVFVCVIAGGLANEASLLPCIDEAPQCEVSKVDITPCANKDRCQFRIGKDAAISFDFTPDFDASELKHDVSTEVGGRRQSFAGLESDACKFTSCPVARGIKQTFSYNLHLNRNSVAKGLWDIKWLLWNKANPDQKCCFVTKIKLK